MKPVEKSFCLAVEPKVCAEPAIWAAERMVGVIRDEFGL